MSFLLRDLRLTFRQFRKNPSFAVMVIGTLALGIGAAAAIFSLVNAVVLRPLPFPHSERLVWLQQADHTPGMPPDTAEAVSYPDYFDWRARSGSFEGMASYRTSSFTLTGSGRPQQLPVAVVSSNFFRVLGSLQRLRSSASSLKNSGSLPNSISMNCCADMGVPSGCQNVVHIMCWMLRALPSASLTLTLGRG